MTALFEMRIRLGGDPGSFDEFNVLRGELAKLDHPACPDVDWAKVEALCLRLFERNGVELQTAVSFILARSYRTGLAGLTEGWHCSPLSRTVAALVAGAGFSSDRAHRLVVCSATSPGSNAGMGRIESGDAEGTDR